MFSLWFSTSTLRTSISLCSIACRPPYPPATYAGPFETHSSFHLGFWGKLIHIDSPDGVTSCSMVEEIVRRSGEMTPLWIEASHWTPNRTRHDDSPRVVRRKLLLKILQDFWPRVEKISVISDLDDYYHTDQRIANIFGSPAPLLKVFKASIPMNFRPESDREAQAELILFSQIAPSLTTFGYDGFHLPNNSPWYSNITRFDTVPGTSLPKKLDKTLKILRLMPLLQYLRILAQDVSLSWSNPEDEEDLFTIDLPCLKCIELSKLGVDQAHEFLRRVKPSPDGCLTNLQLGCSMWEQGNLGNTIIPVLKENVQILYGSDPPKRLCLDIGPFGFRIMDDGTCLDLEWCIGRITVDLDTGIFIELDWKLYSEISDMVGRLSGYDIMDRHIPVISSFFCSSQLRLVTCLRVTELYPQFASVLEPFQDVRLLEVHIGVISELVQAIKLHKEAPEEEFDPQDLFPHLEDLHITMVKGIYYFDAMDDIRDFFAIPSSYFEANQESLTC